MVGSKAAFIERWLFRAVFLSGQIYKAFWSAVFLWRSVVTLGSLFAGFTVSTLKVIDKHQPYMLLICWNEWTFLYIIVNLHKSKVEFYNHNKPEKEVFLCCEREPISKRGQYIFYWGGTVWPCEVLEADECMFSNSQRENVISGRQGLEISMLNTSFTQCY